MNDTTTFLDASQLRYLSTRTPVYYTSEARLWSPLPDNILAVAVPVFGYWISSLFFHVLDISDSKWLDKHRIHDSEEVKSRNLVTRAEVVRAVIFQQIVQTIVGLWWVDEKPTGGQVDHIANMLWLAPTLERVMTWALGQEVGGQLLANRGAEGLYTLYWWAIPAAKFMFGMCVILPPSCDFGSHSALTPR